MGDNDNGSKLIKKVEDMSCSKCGDSIYKIEGTDKAWCIKCGWRPGRIPDMPLHKDNVVAISRETKINNSKQNTNWLNLLKNATIPVVLVLLILYITGVIKIPGYYGQQSNKGLVDSGFKMANKMSFKEPVQPMPANGTVIRYFNGEVKAPFKVITQSTDSTNYYVKMVDWNTKQPVMSMFVQAGQSAETKMPLGSYELRYATGKTWYGDNFLFGPETGYHKAEKRFDFTQSGNMYGGHTVELISRPGGNLRTSEIPSSGF